MITPPVLILGCYPGAVFLIELRERQENYLPCIVILVIVLTNGKDKLSFWGHASTSFTLEGEQFTTDPMFRSRFFHILRRVPTPRYQDISGTVLISHYHLDHLDMRSLRGIGAKRVICSIGSHSVLRSRGLAGNIEVESLLPGESTNVGAITVQAVPAEHSGERFPWLSTSPEVPVGFVLQGKSKSVYFAGDTDLFPEMERVVPKVNLALLPIWGWGTGIGPGHLDPGRAAKAAALIRPRLAVPIHWGAYLPAGAMQKHGHLLYRPADEFKKHLEHEAPETLARILRPGASTYY